MGQSVFEEVPPLLSVPNLTFSGFRSCEAEFLHLFERLTCGADEPAFVGIDWMKPYWLTVKLCGDEISICKLYHISEIDTFFPLLGTC